jgi:hypothetical protein
LFAGLPSAGCGFFPDLGAAVLEKKSDSFLPVRYDQDAIIMLPEGLFQQIDKVVDILRTEWPVRCLLQVGENLLPRPKSDQRISVAIIVGVSRRQKTQQARQPWWQFELLSLVEREDERAIWPFLDYEVTGWLECNCSQKTWCGVL